MDGGSAVLSGVGVGVGAGAAAGEGEALRLRLQLESLSRRLQGREERLRALEGEQDRLFDANERLRAALERAMAEQQLVGGGSGGSGGGSGLRAALAHAEAMRQQEIQQDNMQLLQRMHAIMSMGEDTPATEFAPGVRLTKTQVRGALQRCPPGPSPT